jgi:putative ATP-binding cassette transporter
MSRVTRRFWKRFSAIALPYWFSDDKWKARGLVLLLIVLLLGQVGSNVLFNWQSGELTSALAARDAGRFWRVIQECLVLLVIAVPIYALYYFVRDRLGLSWRRWLTNSVLDSYFTNRAYYELNANPKIDNPDQRISEDVNTFTQKTLYFFLIIAGAVIQLIAFSGVLWSISQALVYFLVIYAIVGTLITTAIFGRVLIGLNFFQLKREADFRFSLVRVRENAEAIALYGGEEEESFQVKQRFDAAAANYLRLINWQLGLSVFQYAYSFLTIIIPSAIIASRVLSGELEVGRATQAAGAFTAILTALAIIVENFDQLSKFAAGVDRLETFVRYLAGESAERPQSSAIKHVVQDSLVELKDLTLKTPDDKRALVADLSVKVKPGQGIMIVGPSGGGKSSLLRAVAGLWHAGSGQIVRPSHEELLFLPQRPYMVLGSLRSQLLYPHHHRDISDDELLKLLEAVNLPKLAEQAGGLDAQLDWEEVLSVGEQQRLAIARVLLIKPRYAMLDEATSALDVRNEERIYKLLKQTETTLVSVSHHPSILKYHEEVLELMGDGKWKVQPAEDYNLS